MRRAIFCLAGLLTVVASPAAFADTLPPAQLPRPNVGDFIEYSPRFVNLDCKRWQVTNTNKNGFLTLQCGDKTAFISAENGNLSRITSADGETLVQFKPYLPSVSFPLQVGKRWQGKYSGYTADNGLRWTGDQSCEVKDVEKVKVPAGEFETYRIECLDNVQVINKLYPIHTTAWFAPQIGASVKFVNQENPPYDYEVTGFGTK